MHFAGYLKIVFALQMPVALAVAAPHDTQPDTAKLFNLCRSINYTSRSNAQLDQSLHSAIDAADSREASQISLAIFCKDVADSVSASTTTEVTAQTVQLLLDNGNVELADDLLSAQTLATTNLDKASASDLKLASAVARLLSFKEQNAEALKFRQRLQIYLDGSFGKQSSESAENLVRTANLQIELGDVAIGTAELENLATRFGDVLSNRDNLKTLIQRSKALAHAIGGNEKLGLLELNALRRNVELSYGPDNRRLVNIDEDIASVLLRAERIEESLEAESRVFLWRSNHLYKDDKDLLRSLWLLGYLYTANQRIEAATSIFSYLKNVLEKEGRGLSDRLFLQTQSRLASLAAQRLDFQAAASIWQKVYRQDMQILGERSMDTQIEATNYASALIQLGKIGDACRILDNVIDATQRSRPDDVWAIDFARILQSQCLLSSTASNVSKEQARDGLNDVWSRIVFHSSEQSPHALYALLALANASFIVGDRKDSKRLLSQFVLDSQKFRQSITPGALFRDSSLSSLIEGKAPSGEDLLGYRQLALLHAQDAELESALRVSELVRDRTLGDLFAEREWERTWLPAGDRARLDAVLDRIQDFDERLAEVSDIVDRVRLEAERTLAVAERGRLVREMRSRLHIPEPSAPPPTLDDLRARLAADTALVSVLHSGNTWWALIITRDAPARFVPFADPGLGNAATAWSRRLRGDPVRAWPVAAGGLELSDVRPPGAVGPFLSTEQLAQRLGESLLVPLQGALAGMQRVVVVADDELVGVPLQALPLRGGLALDRFEFSYAPSLATYLRGQGADRRAKYPRALLAIGAVESAPFDAPDTDDPIVIGIRYASDHPLEYAREEIDDIVSLFPSGQATAWTGAKADKSTLRQASRSGALLQYRYVHFATHAWAQADRPESSAIALAGSAADLPAQRALTAAELAGLHMDSDLVVLSACETGAGRFEHGRGLLGLAYAGLAAGNRAELVSLWPIADDTTARFMQELYGRLRDGVGPVRALARTQRAFAHSSDPRLSDPIAWAPFVLYGGY